MACEVRAWQASTNAGAARVATSRTVPGAGDARDGPSDGKVGQLHDDPQVGPQPPSEQGDVEIAQVVGVDAHERRSGVQPRRGQGGRPLCARIDVPDRPVGDHPQVAGVGGIVDDDDLLAGRVQLLDDAQADVVQTADDDVAAGGIGGIGGGHPARV